MTTVGEARSIFKVLDDENNGYITVDKFKSAFYDFYKDRTDQNNNDNTLNSLIAQMQPNGDGKIFFENFHNVFEQLKAGKSAEYNGRNKSSYSIRRFLSAEVSDSTDEENSDIDQQLDMSARLSDGLESKSIGSKDINILKPGIHLRKSRLASSCKNLNVNPSAASRIRVLLSAGASPRESEVHSDILSHEIGNNFDFLQVQIKRLEEKLNNFHNDQSDTDVKQSKRLKEDNNLLTCRINNLEDNLREMEERAQNRLSEEKKDIKLRQTRSEEEKRLELESLHNRLYRLEAESADLSLEIRQHRDESEKLRAEKHSLTESLADSDTRLCALQEDFENIRAQSKMDVENLKRERDEYERLIIELQARGSISSPEPHSPHPLEIAELNSRHKELENLADKLKLENKQLSEQLQEAHKDIFQRANRDGEELLHRNDELQKELENLNKEELMDILVREKDANFKLKDYIERIIVKVMDRHPSLLEVSSGGK